MNKPEEINSKKIHSFLKGLNETEQLYISNIVNISSTMKSLIMKYKLDKKQFCEIFEISPSRYKAFVSGGCEYSIRDMSRLNSAYYKLEIKHIEKNPPFRVSG